jgi:hypothetical protein
MENVYNQETDKQELSYIISSEASELISPTAEVSRVWKFGDKVLQEIANLQKNQERIVIPKRSIRKESAYDVTFIATNKVRSFQETKTLSFIPIDCEVLQHPESKRNRFDFVSEEPQGTRVIEFPFNRLNGASCEERGGFYNKIDLLNSYWTADATTAFVGDKPLLFLENTATGVKLVMPIEQQRFFAVMRTVEVKVSLKYTNSEYESFVDSGASTF